MDDRPATTAELKELFGDGFSDEYQQEAQERGVRPTRGSSRRRGRGATPRPTGREVKAEMEAVNAAFIAALQAG